MTREAQRAELHKTIWRIANDLRGSVDGWDFKQYVLGLLFYRFISENLTAYLNEQERLHADEAGRTLSPLRQERGGWGVLSYGKSAPGSSPLSHVPLSKRRGVGGEVMGK